MADEIRQKLASAGQEHLLQFWEELSGDEQKSLISQIDAIDLDAINTYYKYVLPLLRYV